MPTKMLTLEDLELEGKRVFLRVDINTPVHPETGRLMEKARLEEVALTIRDLPKSKVVVASHQGRVGRSDYTSLEAHDVSHFEHPFLQKPFTPLTLIAKVRDVLAGRAMAAE